MDKWTGKVAVVTGVGSGIGAGVAEALVQHGMVVVGLDNREGPVHKLAEELAKAGEPGKLHALRTDMRREEDILEAFKWVEDNLGGADVLVNNAGVFFTSYLIEGKTEEWRDMLDVNVLAVAICTREYLRSMEKRNNQAGHIFNICSVAGYTTEHSQLNLYCASKHAVKAVGMSLRRELAEKESTIKVTILTTTEDRRVVIKSKMGLFSDPVQFRSVIQKIRLSLFPS